MNFIHSFLLITIENLFWWQSCAGDLLHADLSLGPARPSSHHRHSHHSSHLCLSSNRHKSPPTSHIVHHVPCPAHCSGNSSYSTLDHRLLRQPLPPPPEFNTSSSHDTKEAPIVGCLKEAPLRDDFVTSLDSKDHGTSGNNAPDHTNGRCEGHHCCSPSSASSSWNAGGSGARLCRNPSRDKPDGLQPLISDQHESSV